MGFPKHAGDAAFSEYGIFDRSRSGDGSKGHVMNLLENYGAHLRTAIHLSHCPCGSGSIHQALTNSASRSAPSYQANPAKLSSSGAHFDT